MKKSRDINKRRRENYDRLIGVGFNSYEATKYKDYSNRRIDDIIATRKKFNEELEGLASGKVKTK